MKVLLSCLLCLCIIPSLVYSEAMAFSSEIFPPAVIPKDLSLNFSIQSSANENSTVKDLHFRFFRAYTNTTINNVTFFINVTKGDEISMKDLFFANPGLVTIHLQPKDTGGNWTIYGNREPTLGGWMSETGEINASAPTFTKGGMYHIQTQILTLDFLKNMVDQSNVPRFDSWWFMDKAGSVSNVDISGSHWLKNTCEWWSDGMISDQVFTNEIQYLIDKDIVKRSESYQQTFPANQNLNYSESSTVPSESSSEQSSSVNHDHFRPD